MARDLGFVSWNSIYILKTANYGNGNPSCSSQDYDYSHIKWLGVSLVPYANRLVAKILAYR